MRVLGRSKTSQASSMYLHVDLLGFNEASPTWQGGREELSSSKISRPDPGGISHTQNGGGERSFFWVDQGIFSPSKMP